jgi:hypothetical protein
VEEKMPIDERNIAKKIKEIKNPMICPVSGVDRK